MTPIDPEIPQLDFSKSENHHRPRLWKKTLLVAILLFVITPTFLLYTLISDTQGSITIPKLSWFQQLGHLVGIGKKDLKGASDNRINILIAGVGGEGHDGPQLTDTIILASLNPATKQVAMMSIPRDLYAPIDGYGWRKINNANTFQQ